MASLWSNDPRLVPQLRRIYNDDKPFICLSPTFRSRRVWLCRLFSVRHDRIISGRGKTPAFAYRDYARKLKWYNNGCPGKGFIGRR